MDGPSRSGGLRQSRRSRSQRDRERRRRRADLRPSSPSSGSDQELCRGDGLLGAGGGECRPVFPGVRHRPPRRRKRESVSCEEDIIDGFAIASFISLEALEMDCSLKPPERAGMLMGRGSKRKRGMDENGGPLTEPEEGPPATYTTSSWEKHRNEKRKREAKVPGNLMETGYICDTESESGDKASDNDMEPTFIVSTREAVAPNSASMASTVSKGCTLLPSNSGPPRLSVTPRVSGLERSQERSLELPYEATSTSSALPCLLPRFPSSISTPLPKQQNGNAGPHHRHNCSPPRPKHKNFLPFPGQSQSVHGMAMNSRSGPSVKPPSSSASSSSIRPPTPSTSVSAGRGPSGTGVLRPSSRPSPGALFTPSPGLPPPPPLLQVSPRSDPDLLRQELNSHFVASQSAEREARASGSSSGVSASSASGGPSVSTSSSGTSSRATQAQTSIPPMAYQFHQHNHQHQHTHTHQHFLHPPAAAPPMFEKYPGKIEGLFRHTFYPQYPPPVPGIPHSAPFSSMQGAFQPKLVALQGTAPEMTARLGVVPPHLQPKDPRITDPFAPSLKVSNKPGKWCAMHVRVAWMILRHQEKVKLMQADPQKLEFRNDLLPRLPGPGGIGGIGGLGLGGALPSAHDLTRPGSLFAAAGGVNPSSTPFIPPSTPHSSFLTPATHLDPYVRSPPFSHLGALGSGAFGGLGSPSLATGSVFGHKSEPSASGVGGLGNPHDPWNRLHVPPPSFPSGPSWAKGLEKRDERDRGKDTERRELTHIKDEKDRDSLLYGRPPVRMSPSAPSLKHRSSTPSSHMNGLGSLSGGPGQSDGQSRERERERERERDSDKRQHSVSASRAPASTSSAPDRPRSSTSSVLTPPPPSAPLAPSPLDLFPRQSHAHNSEPSHLSQRESTGPTSSSSSVSSVPVKKPDRTTTPVSKPSSSLPSGLLHPPVKVKEERKEESDPVPITIPHPAVPSHSFERPSSRHTHHPSTPSSTFSLTPTPGVPLPPPTPHPTHHHLALLDRSRATIEAYLAGAGASAGLVVGPPGERFSHHTPPQGHSQVPHSYPWDPWRELAAQQQQQQRRDVLALRPDPHLAARFDPHLSRLLQHQQARYIEAAVAAGPHHPPAPTSTSTASSAAARPEFGLISHTFDRPHQVGAPGGGLLDDEQRAQILREDFERARYFGMHPHLPAPHLPSPSHAAQLEQLHAGLLSHSQLHPAGAAAPSPHHASLYSRLGPLHPHSHIPNGILTKTPGLVGPLSVGAPPPLIPSVTRASTPPRSSRLGGAADLALFSTHKDGESR